MLNSRASKFTFKCPLGFCGRAQYFCIKKRVLIDSVGSYVNISVDTFITFIGEVGNIFQDIAAFPSVLFFFFYQLLPFTTT